MEKHRLISQRETSAAFLSRQNSYGADAVGEAGGDGDDGP